MHASTMFEMQQGFVSAGWRGMVFAGLAPDDLRRHPAGQNSVAWCLWHVARWQDVIASSWIAERSQVLDSAGFVDRLHAGTRHVGTGTSIDEAQALSAAVDTDALLEYWDAVAARTSEVVQGLSDADYERVVSDDARVVTMVDGTFGEPRTSMWLDGFLGGKSVGWFVMFLPFHMGEHMGEALSIRGQLGLSLGA